jgi:hypothetical protein
MKRRRSVSPERPLPFPLLDLLPDCRGVVLSFVPKAIDVYHYALACRALLEDATRTRRLPSLSIPAQWRPVLARATYHKARRLVAKMVAMGIRVGELRSWNGPDAAPYVRVHFSAHRFFDFGWFDMSWDENQADDVLIEEYEDGECVLSYVASEPYDELCLVSHDGIEESFEDWLPRAIARGDFETCQHCCRRY